MGQFYCLIHKTSEVSSLMDFFVLSDGKLCEVDFKCVVDPPFKNWSIKKSNVICQIENVDMLLQELTTKSESHHYASVGGEVIKVDFTPGKFFHRIYRPQFIRDDGSYTSDARINRVEGEVMQLRDYIPGNMEVEMEAVSQLSIIISKLKSICQTVHPGSNNLQTYGLEIRNLLILTCTEVEAQLKGVYDLNYFKPFPKPNMNEYAKVNPYLKLQDYSIRFQYFPQLSDFQPFGVWDNSGTYACLPWYQAYHSVKHDRENKFHEASLSHLLSSVGALAILLISQYGYRASYWKDLIGGFFRMIEGPRWTYSEHYLPPYNNGTWQDFKIP